jgi:inosose dehydratase
VNALRIANAPVSYGVFEVTVGVPGLPEPDALLAAMAAAGYEGTELGPPGYLGEGGALGKRLARHGLALVGGWIQLRLTEPEHWFDDLQGLAATLDLFADAGAADARPVLADGGSPARMAQPGRAAADSSLGLDDAGWRRLADGLARAADLARKRGFEPVFHHHAGTFVEAPWEIERLLELSDVALVLDTGHLLLGGGDPVQALRDWRERIGLVHVKDVRTSVLDGAIANGGGMVEVWRRSAFCELGAGDVRLDDFLDELAVSGYSGWLVVEEDRISPPGEPLSTAAEAQARNRRWLSEHTDDVTQ